MSDPVWFDPLSPCGSAVRYVASLSPGVNWVACRAGAKKKRRMLARIGESPGSHRWTFSVTSPKGIPLGEIEVASDLFELLPAGVEEKIRKIATELGTLWPE